MRSCLQSCLIVASFCLGALGARAQIGLVRDAPFQATKTRTLYRAGQTSSVSGRVARSSDGSTYEEHPSPKTGAIDLITILDVPNSRAVSLDLRRRRYTIQSLPSPPAVGNRLDGPALQAYLDRVKTLQPTSSAQNGTDEQTIPLGIRLHNGFTEVGQRHVFSHLPPTSSFHEMLWEDWFIPALAMTAENTGFDASNQPSTLTEISGIQAGEPDPALFKIPPGYTPAPATPAN